MKLLVRCSMSRWGVCLHSNTSSSPSSHFAFKHPLAVAQVTTANCWQSCFDASTASTYMWEKDRVNINTIDIANLKRATVCSKVDSLVNKLLQINDPAKVFFSFFLLFHESSKSAEILEHRDISKKSSNTCGQTINTNEFIWKIKQRWTVQLLPKLSVFSFLVYLWLAVLGVGTYLFTHLLLAA